MFSSLYHVYKYAKQEINHLQAMQSYTGKNDTQWKLEPCFGYRTRNRGRIAGDHQLSWYTHMTWNFMVVVSESIMFPKVLKLKSVIPQDAETKSEIDQRILAPHCCCEKKEKTNLHSHRDLVGQHLEAWTACFAVAE